MNRAALPLFALACVACTPVVGTDYRMTQCVRVGEDGFAIAFENERKERRRVSFNSKQIAFGGNLIGEAPISGVKELRIHPVLEVVFRSEHPSRSFGPITLECQEIIRRVASPLLHVRNGHS